MRGSVFAAFVATFGLFGAVALAQNENPILLAQNDTPSVEDDLDAVLEGLSGDIDSDDDAAASEDDDADEAEDAAAEDSTDDDAASEEAAAPEAADEEEAATTPAPAAETETVAAAPDGDPAMAVMQVFETHCARCHQDGQLVERDKPAGGFGYVLDLEALARNPEYVQFGNPGSSQVYTRVVNGSMPKDIDYATIFGPSAEETKAIATWIESLSESAGMQIASREFISDETVLDEIADDLREVSDLDRPNVRYFTLTHLYNTGDTDQEMEVYRQALSKMLNSLSTESGLVKPYPVDEAKTIFRVDITGLGWDAHLWNLIEGANPYFIEYDTPIMQYLQAETYTKVPFVRADWFTFVASQPPLYYDILGLPATKAELEKKLGVDALRNQASLQVARAGFQQSGVSRNNRMIERHSLSTGAYWESFDFAGNRERQSFFLFPLGPQHAFGAFSEEFGFLHDGGEIIFNLPNGLQGYYLTDHLGQRLDTGPTKIVQDPSRRDQAVTNGISCMSCHNLGMQMKEDQVREYALGHLAFPKEVRDIIAEIFPEKEEMTMLMEGDRDRFLRALEAAGVDPDLQLGGEEIVSALFLRFERDLTMTQAAAELGFSVEEFTERLAMAGAEAFALKQRLEYNLVPRDQFVELFAELVNEITDHHAFDLRAEEVAAYTSEYHDQIDNPSTTKTFNLAIYPNETEFKVGNELTFSVTAEHDCYLTLINVDEKYRTTVLFPNRFNESNFIKAGETYTVPSAAIGGFKLIFQDPGKETVLGKCNASRNEIYGIDHNFDASAYTTFDSYDTYVSRALVPRQIVVQEDTRDTETTTTGATTDTATTETPAATDDNPHTDDTTEEADAHVDIIAEHAIVIEVKP
jgi:hypothetical protein